MESDLQPAPSPILNIVGEKVALGPLRHELVPFYLKWVNDFEVVRTLTSRLRPTTRETAESWYDWASKVEGEAVYFTIYERSTTRPIGVLHLHDIDPFHRTARYTIWIGEKDCWGKGYGTEATILALEYGFTGLGLHNIWLDVVSCNERALRAYERAGFRLVGRRREAYCLGGKAYDRVYMECLATEFPGRSGAKS
jgi:RimJ/RimL family protein N-acetyltransferase